MGGEGQPVLVITDPPYNIDYSDVKGKHKKIKNDASSEQLFNKFLTQALNSFRSQRGYICCNWKSYHVFYKIMESVGLQPKACIVWDKETPIQHLDKFYKQHEFILYFGEFGGQKTVDGDVWRIKRQTRSDHPTSKPVELFVRAIKHSTVQNNIILDIFLGSGSTLIAGEQTNRVLYGCEIDPSYVQVCVQRWIDFTGSDDVTVARDGKVIPWKELGGEFSNNTHSV